MRWDGEEMSQNIRQRLELGNAAEADTAEVLRRALCHLAGVEVLLEPPRWRKSVEEVGEFANQKDIMVVGGNQETLIEHKLRLQGYRFWWDERKGRAVLPWDDMLVSTVQSYRDRKDKPDFYVHMSQANGERLVNRGIHFEHWDERIGPDNERGTREPNYYCPPELLYPFDRLVRHLIIKHGGE